jgi:hypothetical protein
MSAEWELDKSIGDIFEECKIKFGKPKNQTLNCIKAIFLKGSKIERHRLKTTLERCAAYGDWIQADNLSELYKELDPILAGAGISTKLSMLSPNDELPGKK